MTVTRITGMASGMDVDKTVSDLMKAARKPLDKLNQNKQTWQWKQEGYRDISSKIADFRNNKLVNYNKLSVISAKKADLSGNTAAVSAQATGGASNGTMTIKVTQLATSAMVKTTNTTSNPMATDVSLNQLVAAGKLSFSSNTITINGKALTIDPATETIGSLVTKINNDTDMKVSAVFDSASGKMSLAAKTTGAGTITVAGDLLTGAAGFDLNTSTAGLDAQFDLNGLSMTRSTNNFIINGVDITLKAVSGATDTTISVSNDNNKIVDSIKSFIKDYNDLLDVLNGKSDEERYRTYLPLTDDQKTAMKDADITNWETKAKSGLLRHDSIIQKTVSDMRETLISSVNVGTPSTAVSANSIGITTGVWSEKGKLVLDESKLRQALDSNPDQVIQLFTSPGSGGVNVGLFNQLSDKLKNALDGISQKAGTSVYSGTIIDSGNQSIIGKEITSVDDRITDMNRKLTDLENQYYKKFSAMETAINKYNSQSSSLFSQTSG